MIERGLVEAASYTPKRQMSLTCDVTKIEGETEDFLEVKYKDMEPSEEFLPEVITSDILNINSREERVGSERILSDKDRASSERMFVKTDSSGSEQVHLEADRTLPEQVHSDSDRVMLFDDRTHSQPSSNNHNSNNPVPLESSQSTNQMIQNLNLVLNNADKCIISLPFEEALTDNQVILPTEGDNILSESGSQNKIYKNIATPSTPSSQNTGIDLFTNL